MPEATTYDASTGQPINTAKPQIDLCPVAFGNTFQHPCFWVLVGVVGTAAALWFMSRKRSSRFDDWD